MSDSTNNPDIPADRADLVLQVSWEIEAIARLVHDNMESSPENLPYRTLLRRCQRLACMTMSAIGDEVVTLQGLQAMFNDKDVVTV